MSDLIERQKAIDAIAEFLYYPNNMECMMAGFDLADWKWKISEILSELSSVQPERKTGKWIPCSERLPKDAELVLVTYEDEFDDGSAKFPNWEIALYDVIKKTWSGGGYANLDVIAWMPLPEPYKEDSDVKQ